jgi:acetolactate synthase-1/2/3 large subunit
MADGYARATGRVGVCLAVCGPGVYNAFTPLAAAHADSVPLLLISGQVPSLGRGLRTGYYHENDQLRACQPVTKGRLRVELPQHLVAAVDDAWRLASSGRPGPVLLEVPVDVLRAEVAASPWPTLPKPPDPPPPAPDALDALARLLADWANPLILAGGGVAAAGAEDALARLAEHLGAPVLHTINGKCALPASHPLSAGLPWSRATSDLSGMAAFLSPLFAEADGLLAVGCRFTQAATGSWALKPPPIAQIDVDEEEIGRHYPVACGVHADARLALEGLLPRLPGKRRAPWAGPRTVRQPWRLPGMEILSAMRRALPPDAILSADVTRLAYVLMAEFPLERPRTFLHPAGAVAMGYGLPAALGAQAAFPNRAVVAVVGDGGFLMSGMELATAVQEKLPVVVLLVNDNSLTLIRATQQRRYAERYIGVDLLNPDFGKLADAFGVAYRRAESDAALEKALKDTLASGQPALVEVRPADAR